MLRFSSPSPRRPASRTRAYSSRAFAQCFRLAQTSPGIYRRLYLAGHAGIRATAANAHDKILVGETSPRGGRKVVAPLAFLRGMLCLNARYHKRRRCPS